MELESLNHGAVDSDAVVSADSLVSLACFDRGVAVECVCDGTIRLGLLGVRCENVGRLSDAWSEKNSDVNASGSTAGLFSYVSIHD